MSELSSVHSPASAGGARIPRSNEQSRRSRRSETVSTPQDPSRRSTSPVDNERVTASPNGAGSELCKAGQRRKSAPVGAGTPNQGLADRKDNDRLMAIMPDPAGPPSRCAAAHVDGCPDCVVNVEPPEHVERRPDGCSGFYRCADCGREWTTAWRCR